MGRRILAFFLGFIFAFVCIAGAIAIVVFAIKINQFAPVTDRYLGDLADMSVYNVGKSLYDLYGQKKAFQDENGKYYSLGDFCKNYNIDLNSALGMELPQEVLDIPAFVYFNEGGTDLAMQQIKVSALPAIVNMLGGKNEDGTTNGMFGDDVLAELSNYSLFDMLSNEEVGIAGVFANVSFAQMLPSAFPAEDSDNKLMWAVGQTKIGGLLSGMSGSDNIMLQLKEGGAFETLGAMELSAVLGESQYINAILGSSAKFADLIGDDGSIKFDDIINGVSVGELLGCQKNEIADIEGYLAIDGQNPDAEKQVMSKTVGEEESSVTLYIMSDNGEKWYQAELDCKEESEGHAHTADCFKYVWYSTAECVSTDHSHESSGDMYKDGAWYARTEGLYAVLATLSITDLTSGNTDALMNEIKTVKIGDIINANEVSGIMSAFVDLTIEELMNGAIDDMYLGTFFNFNRTAIQDLAGYNTDSPLRVNKQRSDGSNDVLAYYVAVNGDSVALSYDLKEWFAGEKHCEETDESTHTHDANCYAYVWKDQNGNPAEGIQAKLSGKQIGDLQFLNDEVHNMTLLDVFGEDGVPEMLKSIADVKIGELGSHIDTIQLGVLLGYTGEIVCGKTEEGHEHEHTCYVWTDKDNNTVTGMMAKLAYKTVSDISNLEETIKTFTLRDVLGDSIPDMLKTLADKQIGELNDAINNMYLGDFLEYEKRYSCGNTDEGHEHDDTCEYDWVDKNGNTVEGMMAKLANNKVSELGDLNKTIQSFTLRDVLGDNIPAMLLDVADEPISDVGKAIQSIYLGSALGYARKEITDISGYTIAIGNKAEDNEYLVKQYFDTGTGKVVEKYVKRENGSSVWYEAINSCKKLEEHDNNGTHEPECYGYVWYKTDDEGNLTTTEVSGIVKALVNTKVIDVGDKVEKMTLGEMGIGKGNKILEALQDTPINEIGDKINTLKMGVVMGFVQGEKIDGYSCDNTEGHTHDETCYCYVWYEDEAKTQAVKGLNAKISNKNINQMTGDGLTKIASGLTIGDLIDSGMMKLGDNENEQKKNSYKLSIIYCGNASHTFNETVALKSTWKCNLADYLTYSATKTGATAEGYWLKCHGKTSESELNSDDIAHRDAWKGLTLESFISTLLNTI